MEVSETVLETEGEPELSHHLYRIATLQERFASFITDLIINLYLIGGWGLFLSHLLKEEPFRFKGPMRILFLSSSLGLFFLYFIFFEGILTATPGKLLGGLSVNKRGGGTPSLLAVFIRNLFRLIDTPLFFFTGLGLMEISRKCRRLGDYVAGTVVLKKVSFSDSPVARDENEFGGTLSRTFAFTVDLIPVLFFTYGLMLLIPVEQKLPSLILTYLIPLILLLTLSLAESFFQTTAGKLLFGLRVIEEDGNRPSLPSSLARNLFRILDLNPFGYLVLLLSAKKQRPGDIVAGTLVIHARRRLRNWLALPFMILLSGGIFVLGWIHPGSFLKKDYLLNVGPFEIDPIPIPLKRFTYRGLYLEDLQLGGKYAPGDLVILKLRVAGFLVQSDRVWIQADLKLHDPRGNLILDRANMVNESLPAKGQRFADLSARFALNPQALPGNYRLEVTLRDRFARTSVSGLGYFEVR